MAEIQCDVVVVGGSLGGVAAAMRAAQMGASVCLLAESGWLGGQLTAQGVCTPDENRHVEQGCAPAAYLTLRHNIRQYYKDEYHLSQAGAGQDHFNPGNCWVGPLSVEPKVAHHLLTSLLARFPDLTVSFDTRVTQVGMEGDSALGVIAVDGNGVETRYSAAYILDATDLGDLLPLADMEHALGAEAKFETQEPHAPAQAHRDALEPITVPFALERRPYGEDHTIPQPEEYESLKASQRYGTDDGGIDGIFKGKLPWWTYRRILAATQFDDPRIPTDISMINTRANDLQSGVVPTGDDEADVDTVTQARLVSLGYVYWLQTECPREDNKPHAGYPEFKLRDDLFDTADGLAPQPYIRESRRIKAVKTVVEQEILKSLQAGARAAHFDDSCGIGFYGLDVHPNAHSPGVFEDTRPFQIPLGALIPIRVINVLPACKNIGVTHLTNGAYRLHPIEWNIGEAAGALAAFCLAQNVAPRDVRSQRSLLRAYQQTLLDAGNPIFWWTDVPAGHPAFIAVQWIGMSKVFDGVADDLEFKPDRPLSDGERQVITQNAGRPLPWPPGKMTRADAAIWLCQFLGGSTLLD